MNKCKEIVPIIMGDSMKRYILYVSEDYEGISSLHINGGGVRRCSTVPSVVYTS